MMHRCDVDYILRHSNSFHSIKNRGTFNFLLITSISILCLFSSYLIINKKCVNSFDKNFVSQTKTSILLPNKWMPNIKKQKTTIFVKLSEI